MFSLSFVENRVRELASQIGAPDHLLPTFGYSEDGARPHVEVDRVGLLHYVVVERGQELRRETAPDLDRLLWYVFESVTFSMAVQFELAHRVPFRDCRRIIFNQQERLLRRLSAAWADREALDHQAILARHPFDDLASERASLVGSLTRAGHSLESARQVANEQLSQQLTLRDLTEGEEQEFLHAHRATSPEVPSFLHFYTEGIAFRDYLQVLADNRRGVNLPPGGVASTFLFALVGPRIVGRVSIRHSLNDFLARVGGHIGYVVVAEFRRRGYATEMLRRGLQIAHAEFGISRALLTCDDDNVGSIRTIEKCGGQLESVITGPELEKPKRRYWIVTG